MSDVSVETIIDLQKLKDLVDEAVLVPREEYTKNQQAALKQIKEANALIAKAFDMLNDVDTEGFQIRIVQEKYEFRRKSFQRWIDNGALYYPQVEVKVTSHGRYISNKLHNLCSEIDDQILTEDDYV